jgi:magnesium-transporting ATPase (P-type)
MQAISYLFSPIPGSAFNYATTVMIYSIVLISIAVILKVLIVIKKDNKALRKVYRNTPGHFIWVGITLIILIASRTSAVPYLSMRFLLYVTLLISFYIIGLNIYRLFTKYPEMKNVTKPKQKKEEKKNIYSTKKKK